MLITVTEERGSALWCGTSVSPVDYTAQCYFTDDTGTIIDLAPSYSGNVYPRFFGGTLSGPSAGQPLGDTFLPEASYAKLLAFDQSVTELGFSIKAIILGTDGHDTFALDEGGGNTAELRFKDGDDYTTLIANLKAALSKSELSDQLAKDKANLEYFDLRFTNKVYYKFSDDAGDTPATAPVPVTTD